MSHWAFAVLTVVNCSRLDVYPPSSSAKERCASIFFCISFSLTTQFSKAYETFPPLEQLILRKWINKNMILCLRSPDHLPCSFLSHDEKRQFSSFAPLSRCISKNPLKSVIHSTTLNLRAKHWKNYSCLVSTIFSKMQIHLLKKKGGETGEGKGEWWEGKRQFSCFIPQGPKSQIFHDLFWAFLKLLHSLDAAYFSVSVSTCFFLSHNYSHTHPN